MKEHEKFGFECQFCGEFNKLDLNKFCTRESIKVLRGEPANLAGEIAEMINRLPNEETRRKLENGLSRLRLNSSE